MACLRAEMRQRAWAAYSDAAAVLCLRFGPDHPISRVVSPARCRHLSHLWLTACCPPCQCRTAHSTRQSRVCPLPSSESVITSTVTVSGSLRATISTLQESARRRKPDSPSPSAPPCPPPLHRRRRRRRTGRARWRRRFTRQGHRCRRVPVKTLGGPELQVRAAHRIGTAVVEGSAADNATSRA